MCLGETSSDSLDPTEQCFLREHARHHLPGYRPAIRSNDDFTWAVLEPVGTAAMPRFTLCRIAPCIMVMVEDAAKQRRFASTASIEDAIAFAGRTAREAALALHNVHDAPELAQ